MCSDSYPRRRPFAPLLCVVLLLISGLSGLSPNLIAGTTDPTVTVSATTITAGDAVTATIANAPGTSRYDWVGFYPVENSISGYIYEKYLNNSSTPPADPMTSGTVTFATAVNLPAGQYNVRLNSSIPAMLATSATITVLPSTSITLSSTTVPAGTEVAATIANAPGSSRWDWVGFFPISNSASGYLYEKYLNDLATAPDNPMTGGTVHFTPASNLSPGQYEIRLYTAAGSLVKTSATITVTPPPSVTVSPSTTAAGWTVTATIANSPATSRWDWVGFYPIANLFSGYVYEKYLNNSTTAPTSPMSSGTVSFTLAANLPAGQYNVRLNTAAGVTVATSQAITVAPPTITLASATVPLGGTVTATIANAPAISRYDWVAFYPHGNSSISGYLYERYLNNSTTAPTAPMTGGTVTFAIPASLAPGQYDVRFNNPTPTTLAYSATITVTDATAPTITASVWPPANAGGWHNTPVTVTFTCSDNLPGFSCPAAVVVDQDGNGQVISRTATDAADNNATASVTVCVDRTTPSVTLATEVEPETSATSLTVSGTVGDALSGTSRVTCNGTVTTFANGGFECNIPLLFGRNGIVITVTDAAGNSNSRGAQTRRFSAAIPLVMTVSPSVAHHIVGEDRELVARDQFGRSYDVEWTTSDSGVASVSEVDGIWTAVATGAGTATLTATSGSESGTMSFVVHSGLSIPVGSERWRIPQLPGAVATSTVIGAQPDQALFSIEYANANGTGATVRALGVDGEERWIGALPISANEEVLNVVGHPSGGLVALVYSASTTPKRVAVVHFGAAAMPDWRFDANSDNGQMYVTADGTVYVVQNIPGNANEPAHSRMTVLDGATGVARSSAPVRGRITYYNNIPLFDVGYANASVVTTSTNHCVLFFNATETRYVGNQVVSYKAELLLYDFAPDGQLVIRTLDTSNSADLLAYHIAADGVGGVMVTRGRWPGEFFGQYVGPDFENTYSLPDAWIPTITTHDGIGINGRVQYWSRVPLTARNMRTGALLWSHDIEADAVVALENGGAFVAYENGNMRTIESDGTLGGMQTIGVASGQYAYGRFHLRRGDGSLAAVPSGPLNDATAFVTERSVQAQGPPAAYGVYSKAFSLTPLGGHHAGLRLVPRNQNEWRHHQVWGDLFHVKPQVAGDLAFATVGGNELNGFLIALVNAGGDVYSKPSFFQRLLITPDQESSRMEAILSKTYAFHNGVLDYETIPISLSDGYNSNSWLRTLLDLCNLPYPLFVEMGFFPGWSKPVPSLYFQ